MIDVEQAYLVSVADLREICVQLTNPKVRYELQFDTFDLTGIVIKYSEGDGLNYFTMTFPCVAFLGFPTREENVQVLLHLYVHKQPVRAMHMHEEEILSDGIDDWQRFWAPLDALLLKYSTRRTESVPVSAPPQN